MKLIRVSDRQYRPRAFYGNQHVKVKRAKRKTARLWKAYCLISIMGIALATKTIISVDWSGQIAVAREEFISPISAAKAYAREKITPSPVPAPLSALPEKDIIYRAKHGDIIYRIWGLESSFGREPFLYCTSRGKVSDMGYNVLNHECFDTINDEVTTIDGWIDNHNTLPLGQLLCLYNEGNNRTGCPYASNFLGL